MSSMRKWLVVSGLVVLQILLGQGAMAQTDFNGAISSAWTRGDMPAVRGLCSRVNWFVSPFMPPNLVLYCAKDAGDSSAMGALGSYYMDTDGQRGFKQDWQQSLYWNTESANRGYFVGMGGLSVIYYNGLGVAKNLAKAYQWCESAIRAGVTYPHCEKVRSEAVAQGITLPPTASTPTAPAVAPSSSVPANRDQSAPAPVSTKATSAQATAPEGRYYLESYRVDHGSIQDPVITLQQCEWWGRQDFDNHSLTYAREILKNSTVSPSGYGGEIFRWCSAALKAGNANAQKWLDQGSKILDRAKSEELTWGGDGRGASGIWEADARDQAKQASSCAGNIERFSVGVGRIEIFKSLVQQCSESWAGLLDKLVHKSSRQGPVDDVKKVKWKYFGCLSVEPCGDRIDHSSVVATKLKQLEDADKELQAKQLEQHAIQWRKKLKEGDYVFDKQSDLNGMVLEIKGNLVQVQLEWFTVKWGNQSKQVYRPKDQLYPPKK